MGRKLPKWCKEAKIQMIKLDLSTPELADAIGISRQYASAVINGKVYALSAIKRISSYLGISDNYDG